MVISKTKHIGNNDDDGVHFQLVVQICKEGMNFLGRKIDAMCLIELDVNCCINRIKLDSLLFRCRICLFLFKKDLRIKYEVDRNQYDVGVNIYQSQKLN